MNLKHSDYLSKIDNCPNEQFVPKNVLAYRWVHQEISASDFIPLSLIQSPPQRILDDTDRHCISFGLSLFDSLETAKTIYLKSLNQCRREENKENFKREKGSYVAKLNIYEGDGLTNQPNKIGHFTFFQSDTTDLLQNVVEIFDIFENA